MSFSPRWFWLLIASSAIALYPNSSVAQIIPDNTLGGENSIVTPQQFRDLIEGGAIRGSNLFHSFLEFNVNDGQNVYFANPDGISNIFTRVTGFNPSEIFGTLGVDGGANLVLLNPNGIHFGPNAILDVSGSFFATTADSIVFGNGESFSATNPEAPPLLTINITPGLQYGEDPPAEILNEGQLYVDGKLVFGGGSVTSTGSLNAPSGEVRVEAVAGDVQVNEVTAQTASLVASDNLILNSSQLQTTGDLSLLAGDTVTIRDSITEPFLAASGGNLLIQGNNAIDILALNHPQIPLQSLGNITLASGGEISTDAHFFSGGSVAFVDLAGNPGSVVSLYDPIISADGDVAFGSYTGASLKVEATGSINVTGDVTITNPDVSLALTPSSDPDIPILVSESALILRAGLDSLENTPSAFPNNSEGTTFTDNNPPTTPGAINLTGNVETVDGGTVILAAPGDITFNGEIRTISTVGDGGDVTITSSQGNVLLDFSSSLGPCFGICTDTGVGDSGNITISAAESVSITGSADIRALNRANGQAGNITIEAGGNNPGQNAIEIVDTSLDVAAVGANGRNGDITIEAINGGSIELRGETGAPSLFSETYANDPGALGQQTGGSVSITSIGGNITIDNYIIDAGVRAGIGDGGEITIAGDVVNIADSLFNTTVDNLAVGFGGDVTITGTAEVNISDNTLIRTETLGIGNAGNITVTGGVVNINNINRISSQTIGTGNGGGVRITGESISINSGDIISNSEGIGTTGFIDLEASNNLIITDSSISAESDGFLNFEVFGNTGAIDLVAETGSITLDNTNISTTALGEGIAGSIYMQAGTNIVIDSSLIQSNANLGQAGFIDIRANDAINIRSTDITAESEGFTGFDLFGETGAIDLVTTTGSINLNNTNLSTSASGEGIAGNIFLQSGEDINVTGENNNVNTYAIQSNSTNGVAGTIELLAARNIDLASTSILAQSEGFSFAEFESFGSAGAIDLTATSGEINLNQVNISTTASGVGFAGSIFLEAGTDIIVNVSNLSSDATQGLAGIIGLNAVNFLDLNNSNITARTEGFSDFNDSEFVAEVELRGETIDLTSSQIDASSSGSDNAGNIELIANNNGTINLVTGNLESTARQDATGDAGNIFISGGQLNLSGNSLISSSTEGIGNAGLIDVDIIGDISLDNSNINTLAQPGSLGNSGNVAIDTNSISVTGGSRIQAQTYGTGNAGNILINATDLIEVSGTSPFGINSGLVTTSQEIDSGAGGSIMINNADNPQGTLRLTNRGFLSASTNSASDGGFIEVNVNNLVVESGGQIITTTTIGSSGAAGIIVVNATDSVSISGAGAEFILNTDSENPTVNTPFGNLTIYNLSNLTFNTTENSDVADSGATGIPYVSVNRTATEITAEGTVLGSATDGVDYYLFGVTADGSEGIFDIDNSSIDTQLFLFNLNTGELIASNDDSDLTEGAGGSTNITDSFLDNIFDNAGNYVIAVSEFPSSAATQSLVTGETPNVGDTYTLQVSVENQGLTTVDFEGLNPNNGLESGIFANTQGAGEAGSITINTGDLTLGSQSRLSTETTSTGVGGNIELNSTNNVLLNNSNISAEVKSDAVADGGSITINAPNVSVINQSLVSASSSGIGNAGEVEVNTTEGLTVDNSLIGSDILQNAEGNAGGIDINTNDLLVINEGVISTSTSGTGEAGTITIDATNSVVFDNQVRIQSEVTTEGVGRAGNIEIITPSLEVNDDANVSVSTIGIGDAGSLEIEANTINISGSRLESVVRVGATGDAGGINITTDSLNGTNNSVITTDTFGQGHAGNVIINANDSIFLDEASAAVSQVQSGAVGNAGNINITATSIDLFNNSFVSTSTEGEGDAGNVTITASEINFAGASADGSQTSGAFSAVNTGGVGDAQGVTIITDNLSVSDGAKIAVGTSGIGNAGNVDITATGNVSLSRGDIESQVEGGGNGQAGNVTINAANIIANNNSEISSSTEAQGDAANVSLTATESINLDNTLTSSSVSLGATGNAGDVTLNAPNINIEARSQVTSSSAGLGNAANVTITATETLEFSDSTATSSIETNGVGTAGIVTITAPEINLQSGSQLDSFTAGIGNAGEVNVEATTNLSLSDTNISTAVQTEGEGNAGSINITAPSIAITNTSNLSSSTAGVGDAGSVTVNASQQLNVSNSLVVSEVRSEGVGNAGNVSLTAPSLRVGDNTILSSSTASSGDAGDVNLNATNQLQLNNAQVTSEVVTTGIGNAGNVTLTSPSININETTISSSTAGVGDAGNVDLDATANIDINNNSTISSAAEATATGNAGSLSIETSQLTITDNSQAVVNVLEAGEGGTLNITAAEFVQLENSSSLSAQADGNANAGNLQIITPSLTLTNQSEAAVSNTGSGSAGNLNIQGETVSLTGQSSIRAETTAGTGGSIEIQNLDRLEVIESRISASTIDGVAGDITIEANQILLDGIFGNLNDLDVPDTTLGNLADLPIGGVLAAAVGNGNAGDLDIITQDLTIQTEALAAVSNVGSGDAGELSIDAQTITLDSQGQIQASTVSGAGGSITITNLDTLNLTNNAQISASTETGVAGSVSVDADTSIALSSNSQILAEATNGGIAGDVQLTTEDVIVESGSQIAVSSPSGQAGNLAIIAENLTLDQGGLTAETGGGAGGANINLQIDNILTLRNESLINANASGTANGGNVDISARFIIAEPPTGSNGSDIAANAQFGNGGLVTINNQGIFGIEFRPAVTEFNDITASSQFGAAGIVAIASPNTDPAQSLSPLPVNLVDATNLIARSCPAGGAIADNAMSEFIVTGRGGLPPAPQDPLRSDNILVEWASLDNSDFRVQNPKFRVSRHYEAIIEAQGWVVDSEGNIIFTTQSNQNKASSDWLNTFQCSAN